MAGLLTFIKDTYKKHWKAFLLLGIIACASTIFHIYILADYPTLAQTIKALFSGDFNISNIMVIIMKISGFIIASVIQGAYYILILQGNLKNVFKFAPKMILVNLLFDICADIYSATFFMILRMLFFIVITIVMNIYFLDMILGIALLIIMVILSIPFLFLSYILMATSISIIKYDLSLMEGLKKACSIIYGYEYRSLFLNSISIFIFGIICVPLIFISQELAQVVLSFFLFIAYIIEVYLYNYFESREEKEYSTLFERAVEKLFSKYDIINHKI